MTTPAHSPYTAIQPAVSRPRTVCRSYLTIFRTAILTTILVVAAGAVDAGPRRHGITTGEYQGEYTLSYFNYEDETLEYFHSRRLQGGGYTWAGLARAGLELQSSPYLRDIYFDPEGDALFLVASNTDAIAAVADVVARLEKDMEYRETCIAHARSRGYLE